MRQREMIAKWLGVETIEVSSAEKAVSAIGAAIAIFALFGITRYGLSGMAVVGVIASMGASAVLLFAVPHGPLSQPWPLLGGHIISAIIGIVCARTIADPAIAAAIAVGASIAAMHQLKCIHPPGGATAFTAVMGGASVHDLGFGFVAYPVLLNAASMFVLAIVINYPFRWRRYPAGWARIPPSAAITDDSVTEETHRKIVSALRSLDSFVDISENDLIWLAQEIASRGGDTSTSVPRSAATPESRSADK